MQQNQEQFIQLYEKFNHELSSYCRALMRDEEDARDLVSETVLSAFEKFESLRDPEKFKYFLFGIASRKFRKKIRRKKIIEFTRVTGREEKHASEMADANAGLQILYRCLERLPAAQSEIVVMHEISGFTHREISEILKMNVNTVKTNLWRAMRKLEAMLDNDRLVLGNSANVSELNLKPGK